MLRSHAYQYVKCVDVAGKAQLHILTLKLLFLKPVDCRTYFVIHGTRYALKHLTAHLNYMLLRKYVKVDKHCRSVRHTGGATLGPNWAMARPCFFKKIS
jgi:hypothetical protein